MQTRLPSVVGLALLTLMELAAPRSAHADDKQVCIAASDKAQQLKLEGKLRSAREQLLICGRNECPGLVRQDCAQWMTEVIAALPSIVIGARDWQGHDMFDVTVSIDGTLVTNRLDGKPFPVDPGIHDFRYESAVAPAPVEERVLVREGEKNRSLTVTFPAPASASPPPDAGKSPPPAPVEPPPTSSGPSPLAYVFGGLGVVALGAALGFDLSANTVINDASQSPANGGCHPSCGPSTITSIKTRWTLAEISLGVGIVSLGVGTYFFFARPSPPKLDPARASLTFDVVPTPRGGVAGMMGRF